MGFAIGIQNYINYQLNFAGGDLTAELTVAKIAYNGDIFSVSKVIGWPDGYSLWAFPLTGIGPITIYFILGLFSKQVSISFIYLFTFLVGNAINTFFAHWMIKNEFRNRYLPLLFASLVGLSSLIFYRICHIPVVWFYFPLVVFGLLLRYSRNSIRINKVILFALFAGVFSPPWWVAVVIFISLFMLVVLSVDYKKYIRELKFWICIFGTSLISTFPTLFLYLNNLSFVAKSTRTPWQSNVFGGRITDLFIQSPTLNLITKMDSKFIEGVSPEAMINILGLPLLVGFIVSVIYLLVVFTKKEVNTPKDFTLVLVICFGLFISGGLGNLQATIFAIFDQSSPARSWSRLIILISILGLFILLKYLDSINLRKSTVLILATILLFFSVIELINAKKPTPISLSSLEEFAPVKFINDKTKSCPIIQLPIDTIPVPQDFTFQNGNRFFFNQYVPFLISDKNQWSTGISLGSNYWQESMNIPSKITLENLDIIKEKGFCGILFDNEFSKWQQQRNAGLDLETGSLTNSGNWPGVQIENVTPNFENKRFSVFLF